MFVVYNHPVTSDEMETLSQFVNRLWDASDRMVGWAVGGQIYADYAVLREKLAGRQKGESQPMEDEEGLFVAETRERLLRMAASLTGMDCKTPLQR